MKNVFSGLSGELNMAKKNITKFEYKSVKSHKLEWKKSFESLFLVALMST